MPRSACGASGLPLAPRHRRFPGVQHRRRMAVLRLQSRSPAGRGPGHPRRLPGRAGGGSPWWARRLSQGRRPQPTRDRGPSPSGRRRRPTRWTPRSAHATQGTSRTLAHRRRSSGSPSPGQRMVLCRTQAHRSHRSRQRTAPAVLLQRPSGGPRPSRRGPCRPALDLSSRRLRIRAISATRSTRRPGLSFGTRRCGPYVVTRPASHATHWPRATQKVQPEGRRRQPAAH